MILSLKRRKKRKSFNSFRFQRERKKISLSDIKKEREIKKMIQNYIYDYIENYNSEIIDNIIEDISNYLIKIDNLNMNFHIRLFNEEKNIFQFQIQRDNEEFYIFDIELRNEYIYIIQSILESNESDIIEENEEIFRINNLIFEKNDNLYQYFIIEFISNYLFELYDIDELREY